MVTFPGASWWTLPERWGSQPSKHGTLLWGHVYFRTQAPASFLVLCWGSKVQAPSCCGVFLWRAWRTCPSLEELPSSGQVSRSQLLPTLRFCLKPHSPGWGSCSLGTLLPTPSGLPAATVCCPLWRVSTPQLGWVSQPTQCGDLEKASPP